MNPDIFVLKKQCKGGNFMSLWEYIKWLLGYGG